MNTCEKIFLSSHRPDFVGFASNKKAGFPLHRVPSPWSCFLRRAVARNLRKQNIMPDFVPAGDDARKTWATAFKAAISTHGAAVGLNPASIAAAQAKCDAIIARIDDKTAKKNAWQASVAAADTGNTADLGDLRATIAAIKTNSGYTDAIGADLGVVGSPSTFDPNSYVAEIKGLDQTAPNQVTVRFGKAKGDIDGVNVYSRLQGTSDWKFLARDTQSPYVDSTPLGTAGKPEIREYRIRGVINDQEIGDYSATLQVTVS
jgi:hypothetical protein